MSACDAVNGVCSSIVFEALFKYRDFLVGKTSCFGSPSTISMQEICFLANQHVRSVIRSLCNHDQLRCACLYTLISSSRSLTRLIAFDCISSAGQMIHAQTSEMVPFLHATTPHKVAPTDFWCSSSRAYLLVTISIYVGRPFTFSIDGRNGIVYHLMVLHFCECDEPAKESALPLLSNLGGERDLHLPFALAVRFDVLALSLKILTQG